MNKRLIALSLTVLVAGCAIHPDLAEIQADCLSVNLPFENQVSCINQKLEADPDRKTHPLVMEYSLYARSLIAKVNKKQLEEDDARLLLVQKYNQIKSIESQQQAEAIQNYTALQSSTPQSQPLQFHPMQPLKNNRINCTSNTIGTRVYTNCY